MSYVGCYNERVDSLAKAAPDCSSVETQILLPCCQVKRSSLAALLLPGKVGGATLLMVM